MVPPPPLNYADYTVVRLDPAQWIEAVRLTASPEDADEVVSRDLDMHGDGHSWTADDAFAVWALVPCASGVEDLLAMARTYRRPSLFLTPGGLPTDCISYGIAGVHVRPQHRLRGVGTAFMRLLHYVLAPPDSLPPWPAAWGAPPETCLGDARFSVLYSGIGRDFYARCRQGDGAGSRVGWGPDPRPVRMWSLEAAEMSPELEASLDGCTLLTAEEVAGLAPNVAGYMRAHLGTMGDGRKTRLAVLPDKGLFEIHAYRYRHNPAARPYAHFGILIPQPLGPPALMVYYWHIEEGEVLMVHYIQGSVPFRVLLAIARRAGARGIELWGGNNAYDAQIGHSGVERVPNPPDDGVAGLAVYGIEGEVEWEWAEQ